MSRRRAHRGDWLDLIIDRVKMPNQSIIDRFHLIQFHHEAVATVITDSDKRILMVESYRYPINGTSWEIPAGGIDEGETPLQAGRREVFEETGYRTKNHKYLLKFHPLTGASAHVFHLTQCEARGAQTGRPDPAEVASVAWFSKSRIKSMIRKGEIIDGFTLTGLLYYFSEL
ncbi:MAG: NUDIX hydrolase [Candidatus Omnitrophica bacterium]|nr:NUDIX hydrolase [Candidatus Omnitrophota bacterium]